MEIKYGIEIAEEWIPIFYSWFRIPVRLFQFLTPTPLLNCRFLRFQE